MLLPGNTEAQLFLETNYAGESYRVEKDTDDGKVVYEVKMAGGTEVEFNAEGKCIYVVNRSNPVPAEVIGNEIQSYVAANYPGAIIVEWELENTYQEVELSNNIEPEAATTFVSSHFLEATITTATRETKLTLTEYEVTLSNGFSLEFNVAGKCTGIDGNNRAIPDSALNSKVVEYVKNNYAGTFITDWDLDSRSQEVELNNHVELTFDLDGNFRYAKVGD